MIQKVSSNKGVKLSPPWDIYVSKLRALFKGDKDVSIRYDENNLKVSMFVSYPDKAEALDKIMPKTVSFGNVVLTIEVAMPDIQKIDVLDTFRAAFNNNPNVTQIVGVKDIFGNTSINYMVFKKEVVQFYDDNIGDLHGLCSTLNEDIAREVFTEFKNDIRFCTDTETSEEVIPQF